MSVTVTNPLRVCCTDNFLSPRSYAFSLSLKLDVTCYMLHHGPVVRVHSKECYFIFTYTSLAFFSFFIKKFVLVSFPILFFMKFPQQNINQSAELGDEKFSIELYANGKLLAMIGFKDDVFMCFF